MKKNYYSSLASSGDLHSTISPNKVNNISHKVNSEMSSSDLYEWLRGFVDGEGCFAIKKTQHGYQFEFQIELHIDDIAVLNLLQSKLNIGKVYAYPSSASWKVNRQADIKVIIDILSHNPLNTAKRLDFEDWKHAFELYVNRASAEGNNRQEQSEVFSKIAEIKNGMNKNRPYEVFNLDNIVVSKYWLLGFIEGEGNFNAESKSLALKFRLGQVSKDKNLFQKIVLFLDELAEEYGGKSLSGRESSYFHLYEYTSLKNKPNAKPFISIETSNSEYLLKVFVPFLESLSWLTKKKLDFIDWANILRLKSEGKHLLPEGKELILKVISQMNSKRLSTASSKEVEDDRVNLNLEVEKLLAAPSNYEIRSDGKRIDKSSGKIVQNTRSKRVTLVDESGETFKTFDSGSHCAQFLGIGRTSVYSKIKSKRPVLFNNKKYYIELINSGEDTSDIK